MANSNNVLLGVVSLFTVAVVFGAGFAAGKKVYSNTEGFLKNQGVIPQSYAGRRVYNTRTVFR